jgi:hypothetical protein
METFGMVDLAAEDHALLRQTKLSTLTLTSSNSNNLFLGTIRVGALDCCFWEQQLDTLGDCEACLVVSVGDGVFWFRRITPFYDKPSCLL